MPPSEAAWRVLRTAHRRDWMTFWRDRRLGRILDQIETKRGSSASTIIELGREVQKKYVWRIRLLFRFLV